MPCAQADLRRLVDTGPDESFPALMARLAALPADAKQQRYLDVFVVTHSQTLWDGIVGVKGRYVFGASREWSAPFYFDVGAGGSTSTFQAAAGIGYAFKWGELSGLWRYLDYNFKSNKAIQDVSFSGPMIGATFRW